MKRAIAALFILLAAPAIADEPMFPSTAGSALAEIEEVYTSINALSVGTDPRCKIRAYEPGRELDLFAAHVLTQYGFPKAGQPPMVPAGDPYPYKPQFSIQATATLQRSLAIRPICLLAMRADLGFAEPGKPRQVYWASPMMLFEVDAGEDKAKPSEALQEQVQSMTRALAAEFVKAWKLAGGKAEN